MTPEQRKEMQRSIAGILLKPASIAAFDAANEAKELAAQAIAKARVTSELWVMGGDDDDE